MAEKLDLESKDLIAEKLEKLQQLFPNLVTEGPNGKVLDLDQLKNEFSTEVVEGTKERYRLEWPGKKEAIVTANLPTTKTLRPVKEDSVDWDTTENLYIEGDNLEVLKILQESYFGKIKMIYIDPPYNTGKDFVYKDNFSKDAQEELEESGQKDEYNQRLFQNPDTSGRYHSDWLSMMYPRLKLSKNLLSVDGIIFISIGDEEIHNLTKLCDDAFGENNFIGIFCRKTKSGGGSASNQCANEHDFVICYGRNIDATKPLLVKYDEKYLLRYKEEDQDGKYFWDTMERSSTATKPYLIEAPDGEMLTGRWFRAEKTFLEDKEKGEVRFLKKEEGWAVQFKQRLPDGKKLRSILETSDFTDKKFRSLNAELENILGFGIGHPPKPLSLMKSLISSSASKDDLVLDFFSGSGSSAHAVMQLNAEDGGKRKHIMVQLPEATDEKSEAFKAGYKNICEIGKERIRRAASKIVNDELLMINELKAKLEGEDDVLKKKELEEKIKHLELKIKHLDTGFRVYRLDESNMADVYHTPQDYDQDKLDLFADNVKPDRTADDLLAQIMLDWGLPLSLPIEEASISGKRVFKVAGNSLLACFDSDIDEDFAKEIAKEEPLRIVFKDAGFASDTAKSNVKQLLKQLSPETEMKVI